MPKMKYLFCTADKFKTDLSELCENCPLTDLIVTGIKDQIVFQAQQQKSLLSKQEFQMYLSNEIASASKAMEVAYIEELQHKDYRDDPYRKNRIEIYIWNKERAKALEKFKEPTQQAINSFSWTGSPEQLEAFCQALKDAGYIDPKTTNEAFIAIFASELIKDKPVQWLGSNRLLSYLFNQMYSCSLILSQDWQSIIERYQIFKNKRGKILKAGDLSTALSNINDVNTGLEPKGYEIIDKILKNLKTLRP